jgi:hypothetical protein
VPGRSYPIRASDQVKWSLAALLFGVMKLI